VLAGRKLEDLHRELDRAYLTRLFQRSRGDLKTMIEESGIKRSSLYRCFARLGLDIEELRRRM